MQRPRGSRAADRQERERGRLTRHRAGLVVDTDEKLASASPSSTSASARPRSRSNTSRDAKSMSACSATTAAGAAGVGTGVRRVAEGRVHIATEKVKHDPGYQERRGIMQGRRRTCPGTAGADPRTREAHVPHARARRLCAHRFPPAADGTFIFSKPIPIPKSPRARNSPPPRSHDGLSYPDLLERIMALGMQRAAAISAS